MKKTTLALVFLVSLCFSTITFAQVTADFSGGPIIGCSVPHNVSFVDLSSPNVDTWLWDFGDGNFSSDQAPFHTYTSTGTFTVSLTATESATGMSDTLLLDIFVETTQAAMTASPQFGCGPLIVNFTDASTTNNSTIASWLWDFGDGGTSTDQNPTYAYETPGVYTVSLTVTTIRGCMNTVTNPAFIQVIGPNVNFSTADPTSGTTPLTVNFTDTTIFGAPITSWTWDFGDGNTSNLQNPTHTYMGALCGDLDVSLTVTDIDGCIRTFAQSGFISIDDTEPPVAACTNAIVLLDGTGTASITAMDIDNGSTDNCGASISLAVSPSIFTCDDIGDNTVTLTVTDAAGNEDTCTTTVTVEDILAPTIICPATVMVGNDPGSCEAIGVNLGMPIMGDNCSVDIATLTNNAPPVFPIGDTEVTWFIEDTSGNNSSCTQIVTVSDTEAPMVVCQNITVQLDATGNAVITEADIDNGSTDNCGIASMSLDITNFSCDDIGDQEVILRVTDVNGNENECIAIVTVADSIIPVIECQNILVLLDDFGVATITPFDVLNMAASTDNCGIVDATLDISEFTCDNIGGTIVVVTVVDASGNEASCTATVTVEDPVLPTVVCEDISLPLDENGMASITADQIDGGSEDNCEIASIEINVSTFDCTNIGENEVTLTVTDINGNTDSCIAIVTIVDEEAPMALCQNITVALDENGMASITADQIDMGSSDNCDIESIEISADTFTCDNIGENEVALIVTDVNGNEADCTAIVTVVDNIAPMIACQNSTVQLDDFGVATITTFDVFDAAASSDNCGIVETTIDISEFTCDNIGENAVIVTVVDAAGNEASCTAIVTVEDTILPTVVCENITVALDSDGVAIITPEQIDVGSEDNCGIENMTLDITTFTCSEIGDNEVTLTVTDINGNTNSCVATVTVVDEEAPMALCQNITVVLDENGMTSITVDQINMGSTDNCDIESIEISTDTFTCDNIGENEVFLIVTDVNGNESECVSVVTVVDDIAPVALCQNITLDLNNAGFTTIEPSDIDAGSSDFCGIDSIELSKDIFTCDDLGENIVILTVTDIAGNIATCEAIVTIENNFIAEAECQDISVVLDENGIATITPDDIFGGDSPICGNSNLSIDINTFTCNDIGDPVTVTLTAVDQNGNETTCTSNVNVVDNIPPTVVCPEETIVIAALEPYTLEDFVANGTVTFEDNCIGDTTYTQEPEAGTLVDAGETDIIITVTDPSGNVTSCDFTIFVDPSLGITTANDLQSVSVYPNPAADFVILQNPQNIDLEKASLYDITGRLVKRFDLGKLKTEYSLDLKEIASAAYFLVIQSDSQTTNISIIKK